MEKILYREGFTTEELPNEVIERIKGVSYKENPYVKLGDLAYLRVRYYDFEHKVQSGELIVARKLAQEVLDIFYELFEGGYEIEKIREIHIKISRFIVTFAYEEFFEGYATRRGIMQQITN